MHTIVVVAELHFWIGKKLFIERTLSIWILILVLPSSGKLPLLLLLLLLLLLFLNWSITF
jgi:hypothetical protein